MYNFYEYLNISNTAEVLDIILAYKNKILSYNQCDNFTERQIYEIKILKKLPEDENLLKLKESFIKYLQQKKKSDVITTSDFKLLS